MRSQREHTIVLLTSKGYLQLSRCLFQSLAHGRQSNPGCLLGGCCTTQHCRSEFKQLLHNVGRYTMIGTTTSFRQELEKIVSAKLTRRRQQTGFSGYHYDDSDDSGDSVISGSSDDDTRDT